MNPYDLEALGREGPGETGRISQMTREIDVLKSRLERVERLLSAVVGTLERDVGTPVERRCSCGGGPNGLYHADNCKGWPWPTRD